MHRRTTMMQSVRQHLDRLVAAGNDCLAYFEDMALAVRAALEVSPAVVAAAIRTARATTACEDGTERAEATAQHS